MTIATISPMSLLFIFLIIAILFGTQRLRNIGADLGAAFRSFKKGLAEEETKPDNAEVNPDKNSIEK